MTESNEESQALPAEEPTEVAETPDTERVVEDPAVVEEPAGPAEEENTIEPSI